MRYGSELRTARERGPAAGAPQGTNGTSWKACSTTAFQSASSSVRLKLEQVDPGSGGGPNRRLRRWSKPLPTSHLLVRLSVWGRPNNALERYCAAVIFGPLCPRVVIAFCLSGHSWFHDLRSLAACDSRTGARDSDLATCAIS